jgi:hypothetical protein
MRQLRRDRMRHRRRRKRRAIAPDAVNYFEHRKPQQAFVNITPLLARGKISFRRIPQQDEHPPGLPDLNKTIHHSRPIRQQPVASSRKEQKVKPNLTFS